MTPQEIYDIFIFNYEEQGGPSKDSFNVCSYNGAGGRKCPVGMFLLEEVPLEFDHYPVQHLPKKYYDQLPEVETENPLDFWKFLQDCHDGVLPIQENKYGIDTSKLEELKLRLDPQCKD